MTAEKIIEGILGKEGGYVDHPSDKGGPTRWGITQTTARAHGYTGDMRNLPRETAKQIPGLAPGSTRWQLYLLYWRMSFATLA